MPNIPRNITDNSLKDLDLLENQETVYLDPSRKGFLLTIDIGGVKTFSFEYRFNKLLRSISIGTHPNTSLNKARSKWLEYSKKVLDGKDIWLYNKELQSGDAFHAIPKENKYHRESVLNFTINQKLNEFKIIPPLLDIEDKEFYFSLKYPEADNGKIAVVFTQEIENNLQGKYYENDVKVDGKQIVFSINSNSVEHPVVFKFHDINIHENTEVFPRVFLVNEFHTVEPDMAQKYLLDNPDFDLRHKVVLEQELSEDWKKLLGSPSNDGSTAEIISYSANNIIIHTENKDASLLILTDAYYPGWVSFVDGSKSDIYRADGLVRAVFIPAGEHTVEFSYMPQSFTNGLIISLVTLVILVGIFLYSRKTWIKKLEVVSTN